MVWEVKCEVITVSIFKCKLCCSEGVLWKLGKSNPLFHSDKQGHCSGRQYDQILTSHVHNGWIGMQSEFSNEF